MRKSDIHPSSFRDPSGFVFSSGGEIFRQVNAGYKDDYDYLIGSGLYESLVDSSFLVPHEEVSFKTAAKDVFKVIKPHKIPFISYPYEWCFSQLKHAALLTLKIQQSALKYGMSLKDASSFNIQFYQGKPILIDSLSFERLKEGRPWKAYRQFCEHFLFPLLLMSYSHYSLNKLLQIFPDGLSSGLTSKMLPFRTIFNPSVFVHVFLQNFSQEKLNKIKVTGLRGVSSIALLGMLENLSNLIEGLKLRLKKSEWGEYYTENEHVSKQLKYKIEAVEGFLEEANPRFLWDLGANTGVFSRLASNKSVFTVSFDIDPLAVEKNFLTVVDKAETNILPLLLDLTNPTPSVGWGNKERQSVIERGPADCVMALALIHHLSISNNLPFEKVASFLSGLCKKLIIEFVPKEDSQVGILLRNRDDIFKDYTKLNFEKTFGSFFNIKQALAIKGSGRVVYLMENKKRLK